MRLARPVARLAPHADLGHVRVVSLCLHFIITAVPRGVALRATRLPALVGSGPVHPVARRRHLVGIEVVPDLPLRIPGDIESLRPPRLGREQILLQRPDPRYPHHVIALPLGLDHEGVAPPAEPRDDAFRLEARVSEVPEHRRLAWQRPGQPMVRRRPPRLDLAMAAAAARRAHIGRPPRHLRRRRTAGDAEEERRQGGKRSDGHRPSQSWTPEPRRPPPPGQGLSGCGASGRRRRR